MEVALAEAAAPRRLLERLVVRPVVRLVAPRADGTAYPLDDLKEEGGAVTHRLGEDLKAMAVVISSVGAWHMGGGGVERRVFRFFPEARCRARRDLRGSRAHGTGRAARELSPPEISPPYRASPLDPPSTHRGASP